MTALALEVDNVTKTFRVNKERADSIKGLLTGKRRGEPQLFTALRDV